MLGTLSPNPWDLPLCRQNGLFFGGGWRRPRHSGRWVGAPVASLRSRIFRPGEVQYKSRDSKITRESCFKGSGRAINTLCSGSAPLAGFEVPTYGRFSGVHRGIHDFADEGKLAAYFGIVPRISNSNETEHSGRITKRGTKLGRTTLVQCALIAQRYSPYLKKYYEKKKSRGTGKAIIALARKFLGIIYRTLKNNWVFEDFPNFVLAEEATA